MSDFTQNDNKDTGSSKDDNPEYFQQLLNSEDYKQLASVISDSVNKAIIHAKKGIKIGEYQAKKAIHAFQIQAGNMSSNPQKNKTAKPAPVAKTPTGTFSGPLAAIGAGTSLILSFIMGIGALLSEFSFIPCGIFLACGAFLSFKAKSLMGYISRFKSYLKVIDLSKPSVNTEDLTKIINKSKKYVQRDLARMIEKRMFIEGHLSDDGHLLFLTDNAYQNYLNTLAEEKRELEAAQKRIQLENEQPVYKEVHRIIDEGNIIVQNITDTNTRIKDPAVQMKIDHLIDIIKRIFTSIQEHPENLSNIRRFMTYYLPTTEKIITAYQEIESQPVQGNNLKKTKTEISESLDTIIAAYETLYDNLLIDKTNDISSDLSVMKTMFSRDGLTQSNI